jgi:hypothetical protein
MKMAKYLLVALNGPTEGEGDEAAYNDWYNTVHVPDLLQITGVQWARRFKVLKSKRADWPYLAAYEFETDDPDAVMAELATKPRPFTPAFDRQNSAFVLAIEIDR